MASKIYWLKFGSGDPRPNTGLTPTFLQFYDSTGQTYAPPSITEIKYGGATASGVYGFSYLIGNSTLNSIYFLAYSITAVSSGITSDKYITGVLDPVLAVDQSVIGVSTNLSALSSTFTSFGTSFAAISATILAIGNTLPSIMAFNSSFIGSTASSFGTSGTDPSTVFGYLKRIQELMEGDQVFFAAGGTLMLYNRTALGTTTLLRTKDVLNTGASVTKSGI
jgi:hypothetical protein